MMFADENQFDLDDYDDSEYVDGDDVFDESDDELDPESVRAAKTKMGLLIVIVIVMSLMVTALALFKTQFGYTPNINTVSAVHEQHVSDTSGVDAALTRRIDFAALKQRNPEVAAWISVPNTGIDDVVMQEATENVYKYDKTNMDGIWDGEGEFLIPAEPQDAAKAAEINTAVDQQNNTHVQGMVSGDAHTMILGHSLTGVPTSDDWKFTQLPHRWGDKAGASQHKYVYVYTEHGATRYRLVWGSDLNPKQSAYMMPYTLGSDDYAKMLEETKAASRYSLADDGFAEPDRYTRVLMLSTCNYAIDNGDFERFVLTYVPDMTVEYDDHGKATFYNETDNRMYHAWVNRT